MNKNNGQRLIIVKTKEKKLNHFPRIISNPKKNINDIGSRKPVIVDSW